MENNGRGIFYGVIGVATLVVAIIGATFAYFSAAAGSNNYITAGGATISLDFTEVLTGLKSSLVPVETGFTTGIDKDGSSVTQTDGQNGYNTATAKTTFAKSAEVKIEDCQDSNGNNICSMYTFTITNPAESTADQRIYASFTPSSNDIDNLKFAIFKGTSAQVVESTKGWDVNGTAKATTAAQPGELVVATTEIPKNNTNAIQLPNLSELLVKGNSTTYTVIVWIEEVGATQKQGGGFTGKINFTTESGGQGVTGVLGA